jgi:hypothetical protein
VQEAASTRSGRWDRGRSTSWSARPTTTLKESQQRAGGAHLLLTTKVPLRDDPGAVTGILVMDVDVTERTGRVGSPGDETALESMRSRLRLRG